jgi:hypothetical protein
MVRTFSLERRALSGRHVTFCLVSAVLLIGIQPARGDVSDYTLSSISRLTDVGGRVDWSPDGQWIAYDRKGDDGLYDVYLMRPDGSDVECLTCEHPDLPAGRQIGQPAWHPSGEFIVMQVEKAAHANDTSHSAPGLASYHDLWVMRLPDRGCYQLTDVSDGIGGTPMGGSLHPVFSHDGTRILWTDMQDFGAGLGLFGDWQLSLGDFLPSPTPQLANRLDFNPGESGHWYESHGFGPDDTWIYFSGNTMGTWELFSDINRMVIDDAPDFSRLTFSAGPAVGEPGHYDEHAHYTNAFDAMLWLNDESGISEYWMANADGSERLQLTHFNTAGFPEHELVRGLRSVPSDNAWNPAPPPGREQLVAYVQVGFNALTNSSTYDEIYLLEFLVDDSGQGVDAGPGGVGDAGPGDANNGERVAGCAVGARAPGGWLLVLCLLFARRKSGDSA